MIGMLTTLFTVNSSKISWHEFWVREAAKPSGFQQQSCMVRSAFCRKACSISCRPCLTLNRLNRLNCERKHQSCVQRLCAESFLYEIFQQSTNGHDSYKNQTLVGGSRPHRRDQSKVLSKMLDLFTLVNGGNGWRELAIEHPHWRFHS